MTLEDAAQIVRALRRHLRWSQIARLLLLALVLMGMMTAIMPAGSRLGDVQTLWSAATLAATAWVVLTVWSTRQVRAVSQASAFVSSGRLDLAEQQLKGAMRLFNLYRMGPLLVCHNLAVVAHGQKNYPAAAALCDGVINSGVGISRGVGRMCRILLADCRLFLGDLAAALKALAPLSLDDPALTPSERLLLLPIELRCQLAGGEYEQAVQSLPQKVMMAEQLDSPRAALVHALLARACQAVGKTEAARFLRSRAELYHDIDDLAEEYAVLRETA